MAPETSNWSRRTLLQRVGLGLVAAVPAARLLVGPSRADEPTPCEANPCTCTYPLFYYNCYGAGSCLDLDFGNLYLSWILYDALTGDACGGGTVLVGRCCYAWISGDPEPRPAPGIVVPPSIQALPALAKPMRTAPAPVVRVLGEKDPALFRTLPSGESVPVGIRLPEFVSAYGPGPVEILSPSGDRATVSIDETETPNPESKFVQVEFPMIAEQRRS